MNIRRRLATFAVVMCAPLQGFASGHGPMFGMTTPTNGAGKWTVDFGGMGQVGTSDDTSTFRTMVSRGITEDVQLSVSVPVVLADAPLAAGRMTGMMPGGGDFEGIGAWRFHRQGTGIGTRFESTAYCGCHRSAVA